MEQGKGDGSPDFVNGMFDVLLFTWLIMSQTRSGLDIIDAPMPSLIAQRCGQPQLISTPLQYLYKSMSKHFCSQERR